MTLCLCLLALASAKVYFAEEFDKTWRSRWVESATQQTNISLGRFGWDAGRYYADWEMSMGLKLTEDKKNYIISAKLPEEFDNEKKPLIFSYTVKCESDPGPTGLYMRLYSENLDQTNLSSADPFEIEFGPEYEGIVGAHLHFSIRSNGTLYHLKESFHLPKDEFTHMYTMILRPDCTYEVRVDDEMKLNGRIQDDFPGILPPKEIPDPAAVKPSDWVDNPEIPDPTYVKPENWDDRQTIPDPKRATKPPTWDSDPRNKGKEWKQPEIFNPNYMGLWRQRYIPNPEYKGDWVAPNITNPDFDRILQSTYRHKINVIGLDVFALKAGPIFDNVFLGDDWFEWRDFASKTFIDIKSKEKEAYERLENEIYPEIGANLRTRLKRKEREISQKLTEKEKREEEEKKKKEEELKKKAEEAENFPDVDEL
ncbi:putative Calnexin like protein [Blattamonas nauphoetae]|uniref:Calnexin like protein n=1 Tax=Blattamonas nauphoetae TaxID=2049346 RepID=A0ABQ9XWJ2_9EUKA|nr:putative Calnexin like protein [Blattamonas nauphoetae]